SCGGGANLPGCLRGTFGQPPGKVVSWGNAPLPNSARSTVHLASPLRLPDLASLSGWHWLEVKDGDSRARALFERHYTCRTYRDGRRRTIFVGPGEKMVLLTLRCDALFVWRKFRSMDGQAGVNCAVFRNESPVLSSVLIREACELAWHRWPGARLYT